MHLGQQSAEQARSSKKQKYAEYLQNRRTNHFVLLGGGSKFS